MKLQASGLRDFGRDSGTGFYQRILRNFQEQLFFKKCVPVIRSHHTALLGLHLYLICES